ncbi:Aspartate--tRNA ligase 2, cytoplasmic [Dichanthelium oligosanthes]|uniref:aspartate--tRNA ligase n=1 Tax=Dichanthelium oligosanthes TaxID=888268 RepID=A0A1E5W348_9POAL|nr:Aspartate--tRNA ligase 2, cytoplasmic [Dichanthelium oligosanthes]
MARHPAEEDESKREAGVGVPNGSAISPKKDTCKAPEVAGAGVPNGGAISPKKDTCKAPEATAKTKLSKAERKTAKALQRSQLPQEEEGDNGDPLAVLARNYGNLSVKLFQTLPASHRSWTEVSELSPDAAGSTVLLRGWAQTIRSVGKNLVFLILRDLLATVQCILVRGEHAMITEQMMRFARELPKESFIEVEGLVSLPIKPVNHTTQQVEISVTKIYCISRSAINLPFNFDDAARSGDEMKEARHRGERLPLVMLDTRLDNRTVDLRTPANQAIFKIQSVIDSKFTEFLLAKGFMGIHTPKITPGISEGGSSVFKLNYVNGQIASLAQSPQLYKQMAINSGLKKVFEVGTIFRAEKSNTHRHLCEYIGLHVEMEIKEHYFEVCNVLGALFIELFDHLAATCGRELDIINKQFPCEPLKVCSTIFILGKFQEWCASLKSEYYLTNAVPQGDFNVEDSGFTIEQCDDLSTKAEKKFGQLVHDRYNTDFFILYEFPLEVWPFYTMPCLENPEYSNSFDAFIRGEEVVSGSQRIHCHELLLERIRKCGIDRAALQGFLDSFLYGAPPRGGFGAGLERVLMLYCGLPNIRLASLFPRDPQRLTP